MLNKAQYAEKEKGEKNKMKVKRLLLTLVTMLFLSTMPLIGVFAGSPPFGNYPTVWVDDYTFFTETDLVSTSFNVSINVWNVSDLGAWEFKLGFNSTLLTAQYVYKTPDTANNTDWVPDPGTGWVPDGPPTINNTAGIVWTGALVPTTAPGTGLYGDITLVIIQFHIDLAPVRETAPPDNRSVSCLLDLYDVTLGDALGGGMTSYISDGSYEYTRPQIQPGFPVADFSVFPDPPEAGKDATLTDTSTGNDVIVSWKWTIANGTGSAHLTGADDTSSTTFHCDGPGTITVTLNVTNNYGNWDVESKVIDQIELLGLNFDLYTSTNRFCGVDTDLDKVGLGFNESCDALSPDLNITLFAKVTWNGAPVNHVLVSFEVIWFADENGDPLTQGPECVLYRTAETDKDGIARIWFRVPVPCDGMMFGKWYAYAACKVQEQKIDDWMYFDVGYVITLTDAYATEAAYIREEDTITVYIEGKSIAWIDRDVWVIVVAYDDCDVPIGQWIHNTTIPGEATFCHPYAFNITLTDAIEVPQYAYVGIGKVYVSAFTAIPSLCGTPYCPELGDTFTIGFTP